MAEEEFPTLGATVLDARYVRRLAEFYRQMLGLTYRPGYEPPASGTDEVTWLALQDAAGNPRLSFQQDEDLVPPTWPSGEIPQQLHLDMRVPDRQALERQYRRAVDLGARLLFDRSDDPEEGVYVFADPEGHPFCLFTD